MSRSLVLRSSFKPHSYASFDYPFGEIGDWDNYQLENIVKPLINQGLDEAIALAGDFPRNIVHWLWSRPGQNDEDPWLLLCQLDTGAYAFYKAGCDYTGFDCQGVMTLEVSSELANIVQNAMSNSDYDLYESDTKVL
jgi:hypothetical protein